MRRVSNLTNAFERQVMVRFFSHLLSLVVVNEYPKSGGTWVGQLVSGAMEIPFPRNRFPPFARCLMHGHYLSAFGMCKPIIVWRDGRDLMVSYYFHCYVPNGLGNDDLVARMKRELPFPDYTDVRANLPRFMEQMLTQPVHPRFTWPEFVDVWHSREKAVHVRYEDLLKDAVGELRRILLEWGHQSLSPAELTSIVERYSFKRQSGRGAGSENKSSFLRKGIAGDWRNQFTDSACEVFDKYAGDALIKLGYERDHSWARG